MQTVEVIRSNSETFQIGAVELDLDTNMSPLIIFPFRWWEKFFCCSIKPERLKSFSGCVRESSRGQGRCRAARAAKNEKTFGIPVLPILDEFLEKPEEGGG